MHTIPYATLWETLPASSPQISKMKDNTDTDADSKHLIFSNLVLANWAKTLKGLGWKKASSQYCLYLLKVM